MTAPATRKHTITPLSIVVPIAESRIGWGVALTGSAISDITEGPSRATSCHSFGCAKNW